MSYAPNGFEDDDAGGLLDIATLIALIVAVVASVAAIARGQTVADLQATRATLVAQFEQAKTEQATATARVATLQTQIATIDKQIAAATPVTTPAPPTAITLKGEAGGLFVSGKMTAGASLVRVAVSPDGFKTSIDKTFPIDKTATEFTVGPFPGAETGKAYIAWARVNVAGQQSPWSATGGPTLFAIPPPVVQPDRPATQPTAFAGVHLAISDTTITDAQITAIGFDGLRIWATYGAGGVIPKAAIDRANGLVSRGLHATLVVTPTVGASSVIDPTPTIDYLIAYGNRAIRINLVNEANWGGYWPGNDWRSAFRSMHVHALRLKAAGFSVGSPSFTGWVSDWPGYFDELAAAGLLEPYAAIVIHPYGKDRAEVLNALRTGRRIADKFGKQLDADEYGLKRDTPLATALTVLPGVIADVRAICDRSAYFIVSKTGKEPHDSFVWCYDPKTGEIRKPVEQMLQGTNNADVRGTITTPAGAMSR